MRTVPRRCFCCGGGGRVVRRCWVNFQYWGVLLIRIIVGQGPIALVVGAGGGCLDIFTLIYHFSFLSPSLWETARYRLKYCLKGPLSLNQPTNQSVVDPQCYMLLCPRVCCFEKYGHVSCSCSIWLTCRFVLQFKTEPM